MLSEEYFKFNVHFIFYPSCNNLRFHVGAWLHVEQQVGARLHVGQHVGARLHVGQPVGASFT